MSKWTGSSSGSNTITAEKMEQELLRMIIDGRDAKTRVLLTSAAHFYLRKGDFSKYTRNLSPASRAILLSGPAELYQQMLAKALAHFFEAKLLLLDVNDFVLKVGNSYPPSSYGIDTAADEMKIQSKYGINNDSSFKRSTSETTLERLSGLFGSFSVLPAKDEPKAGTLRRQGSGFDNLRNIEGSSSFPKLRRNASASASIHDLLLQAAPMNTAPLKRTSSWSIDEKLLIQSLYKVMVSVSRTYPIILYLRDVDMLLFRSQKLYRLFQKMLQKLSGPPPEDETRLVSWKSQLEVDLKMIQIQDNRNHIIEVLAANDVECDDLGSINVEDTFVLSRYIEEIVVSAISYHLMNNKHEYRNGKLLISFQSLSHGLSVFQERKSDAKDTLKPEPRARPSKGPRGDVKPETKAEGATPKNKGGEEASVPISKDTTDNEAASPKVPEVPPDNEFERRIRPEVIPASEISVSFADIGALDETKESLQELVMLPLRRPDLFKGGLLKPCRGILLFGPPGTGKTMLAKAIAKEAGASFINVSMSTITSKWFGEDEKNVRGLFSLASKVSPTIIFVDEVDSMLGQRTRVGEHEAMRKIKNEFMTHWDGLTTKQGERILVLAATNRPFDLDEAIIRRFERRIMVGLPSAENRENILRTLLSKEKVEEGLDLKEIGIMTEGYSGSDLKNLCTTAAYRPVRELIQQERLKDMEKKQESEEGQNSDAQKKEGVKDRVISLRPLNLEDFRQAKNQVAASFSSGGAIMNELKQWNELYGEGGTRKKEQLTYFL
uniref:AAA+ ATPase domain-containing protein n=1 Tax=Chenopodium quinoa TaxID=63459 RepID=A0A803LWC1_CHEQI